MAVKVRLIEATFGEDALTEQLVDVLTEEGISTEDAYILPYGDNKTNGIIVVFTEP